SLPAQVTVGSEKAETKGTNGTVYYVLSSTPVIELLRVTHSNGTVYTVVNSPTTTPNCVWLHDASTGEVRFSSVPPAGTLTFVYRWNSGTTVSFVADFPRGVPGGTVETNAETFTGIAGAGTQYVLRYPVKENTTPTVKVNNVQLGVGQCTLSEDRQIITITYTLVGGETIVVEYQYDKTFADIYEVGLFNDRIGGDMFAISGIGPITKDINTGMRVTWNITFLRG
ncbi:MAG: hypothetical protein H5U03_06095, partial [Clostridia bacterium]|nr:hypothetical protein [Clostridia bacterium]